jgi:hypothetical protein
MALAFKREVKTWEDGGRKDASDRITAAVGKEVPLEVDYDAIKAINGEGEWYSGKKENNNAMALRYLNEQGKWICLAMEGVAKDEFGKEAVAENITKIWMTVTDKGPKGCDMRDIKCFDIALEAKTLKITCNLDFTSYLGQNFPYSDIEKKIVKLLDPLYDLSFKRMRDAVEKGKLKDQTNRIKDSLGYPIDIEIDWDQISKLPGEAVWYSDRPEPRSVIALRYIEENGLWGIVFAFEGIGKDELGKEALQETFNKVIVRVTPDAPKGADMRDIKFHKWEKNGKTGILTHNLDFLNYVGQNFPYDELKKIIEGQL